MNAFMTLMTSLLKEVKRVHGREFSVEFHYTPSSPPDRSWAFHIANGEKTAWWHGESGESAMRRAFEAYMRRKPEVR